MRRIAPRIARTGTGLASALAVALITAAPVARAIECDGMQRSFEGELQKVKGDTIVVDNKKGDKIKFEKPETPNVSGVKTSWDDLKKGDWVAVCSKMLDKPRLAFKVDVSEPNEDE